MQFLKKIYVLLLAIMAGIPLCAQDKQEEQDSLVVLISAQSAQMVDIEGAAYRKVIGPARFLHNDTYLLCDTALWNVETRIIDAWGDVSILQEETVLTSEKLTYLIDNDLAQFRGTLVQLVDKDHNTLRTRHLDYNTKDSVAVFMNGGAMRDKDGQIIESRNGTYDSKVKLFTFENDVNMFTDSIFVRTRDLKYESDLNLATFGHATNAWKDDNMLSSESGWYDRGRELFFFTDNVHIMSEDQEGWCDSLYFDRVTTGIEMLGNAQVSDTTRNVYGLAGRLEYVDSLAKVTMTRKPAVISQTENPDGSIDTVYLGADKLVYYTLKKCDIDSMVVVDSKKRLESLDIDPVGTFRKKAAADAAKAAEEAAKNDPNYRPKGAATGKTSGAQPGAAQPGLAKPGPSAGAGQNRMQPKSGLQKPAASAAPPDTLAKDSLRAALSDSLRTAPVDSLTTVSADSLTTVPADSLMTGLAGVSVSDSLKMNLADSLMTTPMDSLAVSDSVAVVPPDTTKIGFLEAIGKVKIFKKDMQVVCDSLLYSDLDSLARLYKEPVIYQEVVRQYTADSVTLVIEGGGMDKASLMSNAFIAIQEDTSHYDQIKGAEMMAYFDEKGGLERFDVLGGANALFYLEENDALATVNKAESKMLSATFKEGELQRVYYFEQAKNDGYPVVQLTPEELNLKGFNWQPERRPADRYAVTPLSLRPSQRKSYEARPRATFVQTEKYFPGYIGDIYRQIEVRDSLRVVRQRDKALADRRAAEKARLDSLALADSLMLADSLALRDSLALKDSLSAVARIDSLATADSIRMVSDSLAHVARMDSLATVAAMTPEQLAAAEKAAAKKAAKEAKLKAREKAKAEREAKKKKKQAEREAHWAELDKRDADKLAAKEAKRLEKERANKRKALMADARQAARDARTLEKYRKKFEKKKLRENSSK